jgi:predicted DNA-binding transcriptional regulator YafY
MILVSINAGIVAITKLPELEVTAEENHRIAVAAQNLAQYYDVRIDPKNQALMALIGAVGQAYGTRLVAVAMRPKKQPEAQPNAGINVHSITR